MLSVHQHSTMEEASQGLLDFILKPENWVLIESLRDNPSLRPGENAEYQRQVGKVRICASVDVTPGLCVFLRIGFRGPALSPMKAADHLEHLLKAKLPLVPNTEWQVQIDDRWIHFIRRYTGDPLEA